MKKLLDRGKFMGDYSNKSDEELERLYYEGNTCASRDAENKLYDRGYTLDSDSDTWDLASNQNDAHSVGIPIPTGQGTFLFFSYFNRRFNRFFHWWISRYCVRS
nr:hypothetical protein [Bacillus cereus]